MFGLEEYGNLYIAVAVAVALTELVKFPIKKKLGTSLGYGWLYILISMVISTGAYAVYWYLDNGKAFPINETLGVQYLAFIGGVQLVFNYIWEKGLKVVVEKFISKVTGVNSTIVSGVMEATGVNSALDKIEIKDDTNGTDLVNVAEEVVDTTKKVCKIKQWFENRKSKKSVEEQTVEKKELAKPVSTHTK